MAGTFPKADYRPVQQRLTKGKEDTLTKYILNMDGWKLVFGLLLLKI